MEIIGVAPAAKGNAPASSPADDRNYKSTHDYPLANFRGCDYRIEGCGGLPHLGATGLSGRKRQIPLLCAFLRQGQSLARMGSYPRPKGRAR